MVRRRSAAILVLAVLLALIGGSPAVAAFSVHAAGAPGIAADSPHLAAAPEGEPADTPHLAAAAADTPHLAAAGEPTEVEITDHPKTPEELLARMAKAREAIRTLDLWFRTTVWTSFSLELDVGGDIRYAAWATQNRLCLAGRRYRYQTAWRDADGRTKQRVVACDGRVVRDMDYTADEPARSQDGPLAALRRRLPVHRSPAARPGSGSIGPAGRPDGVFSGPVADFIFGPNVAGFPWRLARLRMAEPEDLDGYRCHVLLAAVGPYEFRYWVSPYHDWSTLRIDMRVADPSVMTIVDPVRQQNTVMDSLGETTAEAEYRRDDSGCWHIHRCSKRSFEGYGPQRMLLSEVEEVIEAAAINRAIPDDTFVVQFPDGLPVRDVRRGVTFTWDSRRSPWELEELLRAKESKRRAEGQPRQAQYDDWLAQQGITSLEAGHRAPLLELAALDGSPVVLADLRGQWVLLVFWSAADADSVAAAPYFPNFIAVLPQLKALHERFAPTGRFRILGLSTDLDRELLEAAVDEHGLPWTQVWLEGDAGRAVQRACGVQKVPRFLLVAPDGYLEAVSPFVETAVQAIEQALAEPDNESAQ
jgi:peroxiredoxin